MKAPAILFLSALLWAPAVFAADPPTVASLYDGQLSGIEHELVPLAEAMPPDKFDFAPTNGEFKGVRTFAQQAKHIAAVLYMVAAAIQEQKVPVDLGTGENGPDSIKTQAQVVQFLKAAFAYSHKAVQSITAKNQLDMVKSPFGQGQTPRGSLGGILTWHTFDHYGQMVVYARMNGIIPPASR
jgi:uncharacterized damage-inducible protein DinB